MSEHYGNNNKSNVYMAKVHKIKKNYNNDNKLNSPQKQNGNGKKFNYNTFNINNNNKFSSQIKSKDNNISLEEQTKNSPLANKKPNKFGPKKKEEKQYKNSNNNNKIQINLNNFQTPNGIRPTNNNQKKIKNKSESMNENINYLGGVIHKPVFFKPIVCRVTNFTQVIDKNETNTIKSIIEIIYTTTKIDQNSQNNGNNTLSYLINSEIKKRLGGEWFIFVCQKDQKIFFNFSTISSSDFLVIEIGNSRFQIAKTK